MSESQLQSDAGVERMERRFALPRPWAQRPVQARFRSADADGGTGRCVAAGWAECLSLGGAFVRTAAPLRAGTRMEIALALPNEARLATPAEVVFANEHGMGVRFELDRETIAALHQALTRLPSRALRAMVVEDERLERQLVADALMERGFEVLTACDAEEGLRALAGETEPLDVVVTDQYLPGALGEELVAELRGAAREGGLAIVVITATPDCALAARLRRAGADLLVCKDVGPEEIAREAHAALQAKARGVSPVGR